jgi:phospholipid-binding lipoprotein MlaA
MNLAALASTLSLLNAAPDTAVVVPAAIETPAAQIALAEPQAPPVLPAAASAPEDQAIEPSDSAPPKRHPPHAKGDPLEGFNRTMFSVNQSLDKAVFRPVAMGYKHVLPKPVRSGVRNFFSNLTEPVVFLNDLLQLKPKRAVKTLGRAVINTIFGIGGLLDVAKHEGLPHRANGLGNTLAYYGVKSGPYLFLPLVGPTTLRDLAGSQVDGLVLPVAVGKPFDQIEYQVPKAVVTGLDARAEADPELKSLFETALDPYATLRSVYLQSRAGDIAALHGKKGDAADSPLDDPLEDPAAPPAPAEPATPQ